MDKEKLKNFVDSPEFISGIYNYCDRWCERCVFTARCMNFALGREEDEALEARDITNKAFWERLNETFQATIELVLEMAEERGVDLGSVDTEGAENIERVMRKKADAHPCAVAAKQYTGMTDTWFELAEALFNEKEHPEDALMQSDIPTPVVVIPGDDELTDLVEVIQWFKHQIYVKIMRALRGKQTEANDPGYLADFPKDSDGSAKVALIDIDRSMAAWTGMGRYVPELEVDTIKILVHLNGLRDSLEQTFPDARAFVRPGFDDLEQYPVMGNS